jgi:SAM-dependent methyltransferase
LERDFDYKVIDEEGLETLDVLSSADKLNNWFFDTISPYCKGEILEIGSGVGNISNFFILNNKSLHMSDIRDNYIDILKNKFPGKPVSNLDIIDSDFDTKHQSLFNKFDTIFSLNVVEHIKDDQLAIKNCFKLLKPGGKLITLVPAFEFLYNNFDTELYHFRRYNAKSISSLMTNAGGIVDRIFYFNCMGILGWYLNGNILKKKTLPKDQVDLYNKIIPIARTIDKLVMNKLGLSVISVAIKS